MTLYETIFVRRSVRKFLTESLSDQEMQSIKQHLTKLKQLDGQQARFDIVSGAEIKNSKAPYFILAYCDGNAESYANVGFCLQEMDLYIQSLGLGSLWLGTAKLSGEMDAENYCIMLAFGKTATPFRQNDSQFNRLAMEKISNVDNEISRAARLAPSAVNSQPWKLNFTENTITVQYFGRGMLKAILKPKFAKIDMGIVTKHIQLALLNSGKSIVSITPKKATKDDFSICIEFAN